MDTRKYLIGSYEKAFPEEISIGEMLSISANLGYDFFEMSIDRSDKRIERLYSFRFQDELKKTLQESEIKIGSICLSALGTYTLGNPNRDVRERGLEIFMRAVMFARRFNIPMLQIPACDVPKFDPRTEEADLLFIDNLKTVIEFASIHGVLVGLENMENSYMDSVGKCMRTIDIVSSPYFQLYPDAGNITSAAKLYNNLVEDDMYLGKGHYIAFHLKETKPDKYGGLFYGEGHVDFNLVTKTAWELGARRYVMEYWYTGNPKWILDLKRANSLCRDWIELAINNSGE